MNDIKDTQKLSVEIHINPEMSKYQIQMRVSGNDTEFTKDLYDEIHKCKITDTIPLIGTMRAIGKTGITHHQFHDTPEVRNAMKSVFKKYGLDTKVFDKEAVQSPILPRESIVQPNTEVKEPKRQSSSYFREEIRKLNLSESSLAKDPLPKHIEKKDGKLIIGKNFGWRAQFAIRTLFEFAKEFGLSAEKYANKEKAEDSYRLVLDDTPANRAFINACVYPEVNKFSWMNRDPFEVSRCLKRSAPNSVVSHLKKNNELIAQKLPTGVIEQTNVLGEKVIVIGSQNGDNAQAIARALFDRGDEIGLDMTKGCDSNRTPSSYRLTLLDTPENRAFINANMTPDGKNLVSKEEAMKRMRPANETVDKPILPPVLPTQNGVNDGFKVEFEKHRIRMLLPRDDAHLKFWNKLRDTVVEKCEGIEKQNCYKGKRKNGIMLCTFPNTPEVKAILKDVFKEYGLDGSVLDERRVGPAKKGASLTQTLKGLSQPKVEKTNVPQEQESKPSFAIDNGKAGVVINWSSSKSNSVNTTVGTGTISIEQLMRQKGKGSR